MKIWTPLLVVVLVVAGGCVTQTETVEAPHPEAPLRKRVDDKRAIIDPSLARVLQIVGLKTAETKEGYLRIQIDIQNLTDAVQKFEYRIDWYDREGQPLPMAAEVSTPWVMLSRETSFLGATSPTPAAGDFRITLIPAVEIR